MNHKTHFLLILGFLSLLSSVSAFREPSGPPTSDMLIPPLFVPTLVSEPSPQITGFPKKELLDRFFFVGESIDQVLVFLADLTGKRILAPDNLPRTQISFDSQSEISREEAIVAIESLLQLNGISISELGDSFIRVLSANDIRYRSPDIIVGSTLPMLPSERVYMKVFKLNYIKLDDGLTLIGNLITPGVGYQEALKSTNGCLVTDSLVNLQRIELLLDQLDLSSEKEIFIKKIEHIKASELKELLTKSFEGSMGTFISGQLSIDSDDRTNQIVISTDLANLGVLEKLIRTYDAESKPLTVNEVVYLKHAQAESVLAIVNNLINGQKQIADKEGDVQSKTAIPEQVDGESGSRSLQFSKYVSVEADERSNALLVYGTESDLVAVKGIISNLDVLLPQVRIDVVITEVTLSNDNSRGIDRFGINYDENDDIGFNLNQNADLPISLNGTISGLILRSFTIENFTLATVFSTAKQDSNVRIISAPTLVTTHNREAQISAGESRPVITASNTDSTGQNTRSQVSFKDIGIQLKVKPLIGSNGMVQMEIQQTVESVVDEVTIDGNSQPVVGKREAISFVSVASGEIAVLGGLQEKTTRDSQGKMGFWGSIPIVGRLLFSSDRKGTTSRELIIFIKPTVYATSNAAAQDSARTFSGMAEPLLQDVQGILDHDVSDFAEDVESNLTELDESDAEIDAEDPKIQKKKRRDFGMRR